MGARATSCGSRTERPGSGGPFESIGSLLAHWGTTTPEATAFLAPGRPPLSYAELLQQAANTAAAMRRLELDARSRIAVALPGGPELALANVCVSACAVCVPLDHSLTEAESKAYLHRIGARALVGRAHPAVGATRAALELGVPVLDWAARDRGDFRLTVEHTSTSSTAPGFAPASADAFILPTSGTTSHPKLVPLTHTNVCLSAFNTRASLRLESADRLLHLLPLHHAHGLLSGLLVSLAAGASVVTTSGFEPERFFDWLREFEPSWITAVPAIYGAILERARDRRLTVPRGRLRLLRSASIALQEPTLVELEERFGVPVLETYGMTEATSQIAANPLPPGRRKIGSVGVPAGPALRVTDRLGNELPPGGVGAIWIKGPTVTRGYDGEATGAGTLHDGWLATGDEGYLDDDGYVFLVGRTKEIINRGGQKVAPAEVEAALVEHPAVADAFVFPIPDAALGETVAAAVASKRGRAVTAPGIRRFLASRLATFKLPARIHFLAKIPRSLTGKLARAELAKELQAAQGALAAARAPHRAPQTRIQRALAGIWAEVLAGESFGLDDDFFLCGGTSLLAMQVVARVRDRLERECTVQTLIERPTLELFAASIEDARHAVETPPDDTSADSAHGRALSYAELRLYLLSKLDRTGHGYHVLDVLRLQGSIEPEALRRAFEETVSRHESLRTTIAERGGQPLCSTGDAPVPPFEVLVVDPGSLSNLTATIEDRSRAFSSEPFDLAKGPLARVQLLRLGEDDSVLILCLHHLVTDGWSQRLVLEEMFERYSARCEARAPRTVQGQVPYRHFTGWQRAWLETREAREQLRYWKDQLAGVTDIPLPTDRLRPATWSGNGARHPLRIPPLLCAKLRALAEEHAVTLYTVVLSVLKCLLHRYSRHADIAIGSLFAARERAWTERIVGPIANTVVLRTDLSGDPSFATLLGRVGQTVREALANQGLPLERILQELNPPRRLNRNALFHVMYVQHDDPFAELTTPTLDVEALAVDPGFARFDLVLELTERHGALDGFIEYSTDLFDERTIESMATHLLRLADAGAESPEHPLSRLPMLGAGEREALIALSRGDADAAPIGCDLVERFREQVERGPDAIALSHRAARSSYRSLDRRSRAGAAALRRASLSRGDVVAVYAKRGVDFVALILAIARAGGAFMPLDHRAPVERTRAVLEGSGARFAVASRELLNALEDALGEVRQEPAPLLLGVDELLDAPVDGWEDVASEPTDLAYVIYTSGSTGAPKGAMVEHGGMVNHLRAKIEALALGTDDVVAQTAPQSFDICVWQCLAALMVGGRVHVVDDEVVQDADRLRAEVCDEAVTVLEIVPSLMRLLVEREDASARLALGQLRWLLSTGEALAPALCRLWFERMGSIPLMNAYGPTECSDDVSHHAIWRSPGVDAASVPIGTAIPNTQLYVLDAHLEPLPDGIVGELYVGGAGVGRGYLNDPEQTRRCFLPDPFGPTQTHRLYGTGDLARRRRDGVLELIGRADHQVKLRGHRIELEEIECHLRRHPDVDEAVVTLHQGTADGGQLVAHTIAAPGRVPDASRLRDALMQTLPAYMVPNRFVMHEALPLTANGKVDRRALALAPAAVEIVPEAQVEPCTETEAMLASIWSQLLGVPTVGATESFFDLGGHSLLATRMLWRIAEATGAALEVRTVFEHPTVRALARVVDERTGDAERGAPIERVGREGPLRVSIVQELVLRAERLFSALTPGGSPVFNLCSAYRLTGPLDCDRLAQSLDAVLARHELLRAGFETRDGVDVLRVLAPEAIRSGLEVEIAESAGTDARVRERHAEWVAADEAARVFDLEAAPLLRARLLRIDEEEHVLTLTIHHAIVDGWSVGVLHAEIAAVYEALASSTVAALAPLPVDYADFAAWQRRWTESDAAALQIEHWRSRLAGSSRMLPTPREDLPDFAAEAGRQPVRIAGGLREAIDRFSRAHGKTPFATMLTAFKVVLLAATGRGDLCVATVMANRLRAEFEHLIGPLENTVVVRTQLEPSTSFRTATERVQASILDAGTSQAMPFELVAPRLEEEGVVAPDALEEVFFIFQNALRRPLPLPGIEVSTFGDPHRQGQAVMPVGTTRLTLLLRETPEETVGACTYRNDILDDDWVRARLAELTRVLEGGIAEPERAIGCLIAT